LGGLTNNAYLNNKSGPSLTTYGKGKIGMTRAAAIGGVSKSQQKSWRPLRHEGRLGAAGGMSSDNRMVNYNVTPNENS
jgi:hypothetical protein